MLDFPVDVSADLSRNEIFLKNNGSINIDDAVLYCAFFKENKLVDIISKEIEWIGAYEGVQRVGIKFPEEDLEYSQIKLFLWGSELKPFSKVTIY